MAKASAEADLSRRPPWILVNCAIAVLRLSEPEGPDTFFWACCTCSSMSEPFANEGQCGRAAIHHGAEKHSYRGVLESVVPSGFRGVVG